MPAEFVHLHNHSDYSLLDGAQTVQTLVNTIDDLQMDAVALTEHGNMFSAVSFYNNANKTALNLLLAARSMLLLTTVLIKNLALKVAGETII